MEPIELPVGDVVVMDIFGAKWTANIHREWIDALLRYEPNRDRTARERTCDLMDRAMCDRLGTCYEALGATLTLRIRSIGGHDPPVEANLMTGKQSRSATISPTFQWCLKQVRSSRRQGSRGASFTHS